MKNIYFLSHFITEKHPNEDRSMGERLGALEMALEDFQYKGMEL